MDEGPPPHSFMQWGVLFLLCAIGCAAFYGWPRNSQPVRTDTKAVVVSEAPLNATLSAPLSEERDPSLPPNGQLKTIRTIASSGALHELRIEGRPGGQHCAVRLDDWRDGSPLLSVFVRASQSASVMLPAGTYRVRMACARQWGNGAGRASSVTTLTSPLRLASHNEAVARLDLNHF